MSLSDPFFDNNVLDGDTFSFYWSDWLQRLKQAVGMVNTTISESFVHTFTSISGGVSQTMTVTVKGAGLGDDITLGLSSLQSGLVYQSYVSVDNSITISCTNITASAITPTAGNIRVTVRSFL